MTKSPRSGTGSPWYGLTYFLSHLALAGLTAWSLWRIVGGGWLGAGIAAAAVLGYAALWRIWLAPASRRRLSYRKRILVEVMLASLVVVIAALGNLWLATLIVAGMAILSDALNQGVRRRQA